MSAIKHNLRKQDRPVCRPDPDTGKYELIRPFEFTAAGTEFSIQIGEQWDGASIPKGAWYTTYSPFHPKVMTAALVHDYFCWRRFAWFDYEMAAELFDDLLKIHGAGDVKRKLMVRAVKWFGPRW